MKLYIGVTKEDELYFIEWDKIENKQRKTFSLCGGCYNEPKTEEQGEEEAREVLNNPDYWEGLGMIDSKSFLTRFINFDDVAEEVLNTGGWENVNGEYSHFGEYNEEEIYLNYSIGGQHQENLNNFKELWISKEDFKKINSLWDKEHLKPLKEDSLKYMSSIFEKYKSLCSDEEVLNKFLRCIEWQQ